MTWKKMLLLPLAALIVFSSGCGRTMSLQVVPQPDQAPILNASTPIVISTSINQFVAIDKPVYVQFSRDMDAATINHSTFYIANVAATISYDAVNRIAYLRPNAPLAPNTVYKPTVTTGVRDTLGTAMPVQYTFLVQTRDTPDQSTPTAIFANQGCVATDGTINVRFSEAMDTITITTGTFLISGVTGSVTYDALTHVATFHPTTAFAANTTYNGTITTGAADLGGVQLAADYNFSFTTCPDNTPHGFCSFTKGGYAGPGTPGQIFDANFATVFENDLTLGINDGSGPLHSARWQAVAPGPANLKSYLTSPAGGASAAFNSDGVNLSATANGQLPEQAAALTLNIGFSGSGTPPGFEKLVLTGTGTSLDGASVEDILGFTNNALAGNGLPQGFTFSSLSDLNDNLNQSWDDCTQDDWAKSHLVEPSN